MSESCFFVLSYQLRHLSRFDVFLYSRGGPDLKEWYALGKAWMTLASPSALPCAEDTGCMDLVRERDEAMPLGSLR